MFQFVAIGLADFHLRIWWLALAIAFFHYKGGTSWYITHNFWELLQKNLELTVVFDQIRSGEEYPLKYAVKPGRYI